MSTATIDRPAPPPTPSHAQFLISQTRSSLAHLRTCGALDAITFTEVDRLLTRAVLNETAEDKGLTRSSAPETESEKLGRRNAWLRETLKDTSLLPTLVETALNIAIPGPILSDTQKDAIVELVERSQSAIAEQITNPRTQRRAQSGAFGTAKTSYAGLKKGLNAAGQSMNEVARKREEARLRAEEKKAEKEGQKSIKEELKREREAIARQRQQELLEGPSSASSSSNTTALSSESSMNAARRASASRGAQDPTMVASPSALSIATTSSLTPSFGRSLPPQTGGQIHRDHDSNEASIDSDGSSVATVSCDRIPSPENNSVAATTHFSPWPGLLLSQTLVAISDEPVPSVRFGFGQIAEESSGNNGTGRNLPPPPKRTAAPASSAASREPTSSLSPSSIPPRQDTTYGQSEPHNDGSEIVSEGQGSEARRASGNPVSAPAFSSTSERSDLQSSQYAIPPPMPVAPSTPKPPPSAQGESTFHPRDTVASSSRPAPNVEQQWQPSTISSQPSRPPTTTQVQDVTEQKNKSWTKKLGL